MEEGHVFIRTDKVDAIVGIAKSLTENPLEGFTLLILAAKSLATAYKQDDASWDQLPALINEILLSKEVHMPAKDAN